MTRPVIEALVHVIKATGSDEGTVVLGGGKRECQVCCHLLSDWARTEPRAPPRKVKDKLVVRSKQQVFEVSLPPPPPQKEKKKKKRRRHG